MRVVYVASSLQGRGGIERIICNKTTWFCNNNIDVHIIISGDDDKEFFYKYHKAIKFHFLGVNYKKTNSIAGTYDRLKQKNSHRKSLNNILLKIDADITIFTDPSDLFLNRGLKDKSKKICELHYNRSSELIKIKHGNCY